MNYADEAKKLVLALHKKLTAKEFSPHQARGAGADWRAEVNFDELDALYRASTQGEWVNRWREVADQNEDDQFVITCEGAPAGGVVIGWIYYDGRNIAIRERDAAWIVAVHNAWPEVVGRLRKMEAEASEAALSELASEAQRLDLGYGPSEATTLRAERDQARAERDAAVGLLTQQQWAGTRKYTCPWCRRQEGNKVHAHDCPAAIVCGWAREERGT